MEYQAFERRLLRLMFRTNVPLTAVHVAYHLDLPIAEARAHLEAMVQAGVLELDSDDAGYLLYRCPLRPQLATLPDPPPPRRRKRKKPRPTPTAAEPTNDAAALVPFQSSPPLAPSADDSFGFALEDRRYSPTAAAALSFFLPGVGQIYSGRLPQGVGWMLATGLGYLLFLVPGLILHICCVVNAAAIPKRLPLLEHAR